MTRQIFLACLSLFAALAFAAPAAADDASDIRSVISRQLDAFRSDDAPAAYSHAAPNIQAMFPTPQVFMGMVQSAYDPVYRPNSVVFGALKADGTGFRQEVHLTDRKGQSWIASYTLEREPDGTMKITSCTLRKGDDLAA
ncbi:DUF4864 domain-containing protein [Aurantimonas sp. VKM B-3413]|uniref:DUF4864 domain-containing protein n=1 Tax=Aurantimonas sp. VKM B-3413 TaxID=2779401 RepID=UPI001E5B7DBE|nr:DUF4864 domain-containing protein [Aurantimonas sp. VKM B-3413]MCB8836179.1 DUF4864 domain-containing protein [Aurantimonas sp. VKM B-3413]